MDCLIFCSLSSPGSIPSLCVPSRITTERYHSSRVRGSLALVIYITNGIILLLSARSTRHGTELLAFALVKHRHKHVPTSSSEVSTRASTSPNSYLGERLCLLSPTASTPSSPLPHHRS
ncbi:unnamed protein product [Sympodiomycopsis kandeliae]